MTTADQWQNTFDAISDAVCVLDREGNILQCNNAMSEMASKPAAELAGRPVCQFIHGSANALQDCPWRRAQKSKKREKSKIAIGDKWFEVTVDPILSPDHKLMGGIHIVSDITERKWAEQALRESEAQLRQLFNTSPDARFLISADGRFLDANQAALDRYGYGPAELRTMTPADLASPDLKDKSLSQVQKAIRDPLQFEWRHRSKDGREFPVEIYTQPITIDGKRCTYAEVRDISERKRAEDDLNQTLKKLRLAFDGAVKAIALMAETRDPYTSGHQQRVARIAAGIAEELGLPKDEVETIALAGFLHDIGKVSVPADILNKPGQLAKIEMTLIRGHSGVGYDIVQKLDLPWAVGPILRQHHERMDGSGYPQGLAGENIALDARILAVADVVEAMISHRPYRPGLGLEMALQEIIEKKGILYDPAVVEACLRLFREKGFKIEDKPDPPAAHGDPDAGRRGK